MAEGFLGVSAWWYCHPCVSNSPANFIGNIYITHGATDLKV